MVTLPEFLSDLLAAVAGAFVGVLGALKIALVIHEKTRADEQAKYKQQREDEQARILELEAAQRKSLHLALRAEIDGNLLMLRGLWGRFDIPPADYPDDDTDGPEADTEASRLARVANETMAERERTIKLGHRLANHAIPDWNTAVWQGESVRLPHALSDDEFWQAHRLYGTLKSIHVCQQLLIEADQADTAAYAAEPAHSIGIGPPIKHRWSRRFNAACQRLIPILEADVLAVLVAGNPVGPN